MLLQSKRWIGLSKGLPDQWWRSIFAGATVAGVVYLVCGVLGLWLSESGLAKILEPNAEAYQYWDAINYVRLGFTYSCQEFYPLWPHVLGTLTHRVETGLQMAMGLSTLLFFSSLPLTYWVFRRLISKPGLALLAFLLYVLNPNSVFHANGYTEGGFSVMAVLALAVLVMPGSVWGNGLLLGMACLMSLMRPSLFQLVGAAIGAWVCVHLASRALSYPLRQRHDAATGLLVTGAIAGYAVYGTYCLNTVNNFLGPFQAQVEWGRRLGFRPLFLLLPRSLLNDLHGLYFPFVLFGLVLVLFCFRLFRRPLLAHVPTHPLSWITLFYPPLAGIVYSVQSWRRLRSQRLPTWTVPPAIDALVTSYPFWFCLLVCMANATIGFLAASGSLYSLARFVFAPPFFFIALGMVANALDGPKMRQFLLGGLFLSVVGLIDQWYKWGNGSWIG
ncbi:MAG: hypothetical protein AAFU71_17160 [Cyanobacteria bacterium J06632_22]